MSKKQPKANTIKYDDGVEIYENEIFVLCDEYINTLNDPNDINNNRCFTGLIKYIYINYNSKLLNNNKCNNNNNTANRYNDIQLLDRLFNIYVSLCYKYNNIPTILEYSLFTGISRDIIHDWKTGNRRELTPEYVHTVKKWYEECELAQVKEKDIKSIFLLKSNYLYNDNLASIPIESQGIKQTIEQLPDLGSNNEPIAINEKREKP